MIPMVLLAVILGKPVPEWPSKPPDRWIQGGPLTLAELAGQGRAHPLLHGRRLPVLP